MKIYILVLITLAEDSVDKTNLYYSKQCLNKILLLLNGMQYLCNLSILRQNITSPLPQSRLGSLTHNQNRKFLQNLLPSRYLD